MAKQCVPYIFFYGRCEEALEFYKGIFGGDYEMMRVSDSPVAGSMPPEAAKSVMHASFTSDEIAFMASDGQQIKTVDPDAGNISLALTLDEGDRGESVFNALATGGQIGMPIDKAFWGGRFGSVTDRFGTEWMIALP